MDLSSLSRKSSDGRTVFSLHEKTDQAKAMLQLSKTGQSFRIPDMLFGYLIATTGVDPRSRIAYDLKQQFDTVQSLFFEKALNAETVALITVDAVSEKKRMSGQNEG